MKNAARTSSAIALLILALLCVCLCAAPLAYAETSAEKQAEADRISESIDALQTNLNEATAEYERATEAYKEATRNAEAASMRAQEALSRIGVLQERLGKRVTTVYRNGGTMRFLDVLLGAGSFAEFLTSWDAIETISAQDASLVQESKQVRAEAKAAEEEFKAEQERASREVEAAEAAQKQIEADKAAMEAELSKVNEEVAVLLAHEEEERLEAEEAARREALAQQLLEQYGSGDASAGTSGGETYSDSVFDGWVLPCNYYGVTCEFGYSPITYSHNGIDLGASSGTPIWAAGPGTVTYAGWYSTGGLAVIISHGSGVRTIYMHQSEIAASVGQWVNAGDLIGYVGSTGLSTGPHLHFQVEINGTPVNPRGIMNF